ncbi:MAG: HAMP domain-containing histidine kinase [Alphaproteobacteria bacterium]|nr:HAMP domain-containing histidine kinase [Alphaproteobacteria bacterium]
MMTQRLPTNRSNGQPESSDDRVREHALHVSGLMHDLRTPLNAVVGFASLIADQTHGAVAERHVGHAKDILAAAEMALRLVKAALQDEQDLAETIGLKPNIQPVDLKEEIAAVMNLFAEEARKSEIRLKSNLDADLEAIRSDPDMIRRILMNLIGNAIKATPRKGRVTVSAQRERASGALVMVVSDTGYGMSPEDLAVIMQPVPLHRPPRDKNSQGHGLGLLVVRRLVAALGGEFELRSRAQVGTSAIIHLPAIGPSSPAPG